MLRALPPECSQHAVWHYARLNFCVLSVIMVVLAYLVPTVFCFCLSGLQAHDTKTGGNFNHDYDHCAVTFPSNLLLPSSTRTCPFPRWLWCFVLSLLLALCWGSSFILRQTLSGWLCDTVKKESFINSICSAFILSSPPPPHRPVSPAASHPPSRVACPVVDLELFLPPPST